MDQSEPQVIPPQNAGASPKTRKVRKVKKGGKKRKETRENQMSVLSLSVKLPAIIISLLGVALLATIVVVTANTRTAITEEIVEEQATTAEELDELLDSFFVQQASRLQILTFSEILHDELEERNESYSEGGAGEDAIVQSIQNLDALYRQTGGTAAEFSAILSEAEDVNLVTDNLGTFKEAFEEYLEIFVTDAYGATFGSTDLLTDYYQADEDWWQAAYNGGEGAVYISQPEYDASADAEVIQIAVPVEGDESGELLGIMRASLSTEALYAFVAEPTFGETGYAVLARADGSVVYDPRAEEGVTNERAIATFATAFAADDEGTGRFTDANGEEVLYSYSSLAADDEELESDEGEFAERTTGAVNDLGFFVVVRQEVDEALAAVTQITLQAIIIGGIAAVVASILAVLFARSITAPLYKLTYAARRIGRGDLSQLLDIKSNDELGLLANSLNQTTVRLRGMVQTEEDRDEERRQREMLQSNIGSFLDVAMDIADGDLTKRGAVSEDVLGNVVDAINLMVEEVAYLLRDVQEATLSVNQGSQEMLSLTDSISASSDEAASQGAACRAQRSRGHDLDSPDVTECVAVRYGVSACARGVPPR